MKLLTVPLLAALFSLNSASAIEVSLDGHWSGALSRGGSVQLLTVHLSDDQGALSGTYDIPELGFFNLPIKELVLVDNTIQLKFLYGTFRGFVHEGVAEIAAVTENQDIRTMLHLKRSPPPARCTSEPVSFESGDVTLAGTLLRPISDGRHPGAVILHDSAPRHRNHRSYRVYGEMYCRAGIASLIYDKRGVGASTGDFESTSLEDLKDDAVAAYMALEENTNVQRDRIGFIGFSQGGWIGPWAASQLPNTSFVVMVAGASVPVWTQEMHRVEYEMRAGEFTEQEIDTALAHTRAIFDTAVDPAKWSALEKSVAIVHEARWAEYVYLPESQEEAAEWLLEEYDPEPVLTKLDPPLLAIFGGNDTSVPPSENVDQLKKYLEQADNADSEILVLTAMGHSLYRGSNSFGSGDFPAGLYLWDRLEPGLFEKIIPWTLEQLSK